jgi:N-acetylneuraminic acid mutarotase
MNVFSKLLLIAAVAAVLSGCSGTPTQSNSSSSSSLSSSGGYTIGGAVTGLSGTGLVLQDNSGNNLSITASGAFTFTTGIATGKTYSVTVLTQPAGPAQTCTVTNGAGTATANVTNVAISCTNNPVTATIGGSVAGLSGTGLVLQDNGGDSLTITANGAFTFKTPVTGPTDAYAVTVLTQPINPTQICTVASGSGTATGNVTNVAVNCVLSYTIGGTVTGVVGTGLVLQNTGAELLPITANGAFTFKNQVPTGTAYSVTISTQPSSPAQTCSVTPATGSGTATSNITSVAITCAAITFSVGGTVVGLEGSHTAPVNNNPLTDSSFIIQDNTGDNKIITQNGPFTFATPVALNGAYNISVFTSPSTQFEGCIPWNYKGVVTANVTNVVLDCGHNDWTWINGTETAGTIQAPQYGSFPTSPPSTVPNPYTNTPGARDLGAAWTDSSGNLWLFGGLGWELSGKSPPDTLYGYLSDLWECPIVGDQCQWSLVYNAVSSNTFTIAENENWAGVYGTQGSAAAGNLPGGRWGAATSADNSGNLWMFGGEGEDVNGSNGLLNDLWEYNIGTNEWTWVNGSKFVNQKGTYSGTEVPGARWGAVYWTDQSKNFWVFGGFGYDANGNVGFLNDLWEFNGTSWTFVSGTSTANQNGVYGTQGTGSVSNIPGGRQEAVGWLDASGNLWLFGGEGEDSVGTANGILNDLWEYTISSNKWTFVTGSKTANQTGVYGLQPSVAPANTTGAAGTVGLTVTPGTIPGSRWGATAWTDLQGNLWLFGGWGLDSTGTNGNGFLNDLWAYTPNSTAGQAGTWVWVKGSNTGNANGTYGSLLRPYEFYEIWTPGGRRGATHWVDGLGQLWLFGGQGYDSTSASGNGYLNDLWRYLPYP